MLLTLWSLPRPLRPREDWVIPDSPHLETSYVEAYASSGSERLTCRSTVPLCLFGQLTLPPQVGRFPLTTTHPGTGGWRVDLGAARAQATTVVAGCSLHYAKGTSEPRHKIKWADTTAHR